MNVSTASSDRSFHNLESVGKAYVLDKQGNQVEVCIKRELGNLNHFYYLLDSANKLVGEGAIVAPRESTPLKIVYIRNSRPQEFKHIGKRLVDLFFQISEQLKTDLILVSSPAPVGFYFRYGFELLHSHQFPDKEALSDQIDLAKKGNKAGFGWTEFHLPMDLDSRGSIRQRIGEEKNLFIDKKLT